MSESNFNDNCDKSETKSIKKEKKLKNEFYYDDIDEKLKRLEKEKFEKEMEEMQRKAREEEEQIKRRMEERRRKRELEKNVEKNKQKRGINR